MENIWPGDRLDLSQQRTKSSVATGYTRFQNGDVLVPKITPTFEASRSVWISNGLINGTGAGTTELHILRAGPEIDPRFLLYITHAHPFLKLGEAEMYGVAGQKRVPDDFIRNFLIKLPSIKEQRRVADFIDIEANRFNHIEISMRKQLALLTEKRIAVINSAVTSEPQAPRLRLGYQVGLVTSGPRGWGDYSSDDGELFFRSGNLHRDDISPNMGNTAYIEIPKSASTEALRSRICAGDILVGITGANTGWVTHANEGISGAYVSQHVCLIRPTKNLIDSHWLAYAISSSEIQEELMAGQYGGTKTQLSLPDIRNVPLPVISLEKQRNIARNIEGRLNVIKHQRAAYANKLRLLIERKRTLITAMVMG